MRTSHLIIAAAMALPFAVGAASYVGNPPKAGPAQATTFRLVQNVRQADGWHAYVRDHGLTLDDCLGELEGMRSTGCEIED